MIQWAAKNELERKKNKWDKRRFVLLLFIFSKKQLIALSIQVIMWLTNMKRFQYLEILFFIEIGNISKNDYGMFLL